MPVQGLTVQTVLPSLQMAERGARNRANILSQAQARVPDAQTFAKTILDKDLHGVESNKFVSAINNLATDYLTKYEKNPFYAFSREGKETAKKMQSIVTNPALQRMENVKKQNDEEYKRVASKGLQSNLMITDGGGLAILNAETKQREIINPEDFDRDIHQALTIADDYSYLDLYEGSDRTASYDIDTLENITANIRSAVSGLGIDKWKKEYDRIKTTHAGQSLGEGVGVTDVIEGESNQAQIQNVLDFLTTGGMSQKAMKTLLSQYYRSNPDELGLEGSSQRAAGWITDQVNRVAKGQRISTARTTTKAATGLGTSDGAGGTAKVLPWDKVNAGAFGTRPEVQEVGDITKGGARRTGVRKNIPLVWSRDTNNDFKDSDTGATVANLTFENLTFTQAADLNNIQMGIDADNEGLKLAEGDYTRIPMEALQGSIMKYDLQPAGLVQHPIDIDGNIINPITERDILTQARMRTLSPADEKRYRIIDADTNPRFTQQQFISTIMIIPRRRGLFDTNIGNEEYLKQFKDSGYKSSEKYTDMYNKHSGADRLGSPGTILAYDDETYAIKVNIAIQEGATPIGFNTLLGADDTLVPKSQNLYENQIYQRRPAVSGNQSNRSIDPDLLLFSNVQ